MSQEKVKVFKMLTKGFGDSFVEMGNVLVTANAKLSNELKIEIVAKLGLAEDLVSDVCKYFTQKEH